MYIHKSHMSAVVYTSTSHRPTHLNLKFCKIRIVSPILQNQFIFQNKTKLESSYDTLRSLIINWLNKVRCLESIGMLKSTQKHEKTRFQNSAELTQSRHQDTRSCHPLQENLTRSCHVDIRSCHLTSTAKMHFHVFAHKILFQIRFRQCIPNT